MIVARDTPCSREISLIEAPALCLAKISARCSAVVVAGRPSVLPCCFARCNSACVRSSNRSRSSSATAASIVLPAGEVRSSAPSCRTMTLMLRDAKCLMIPPTSCASRPSRSSLETTSVSPFRIWVIILANSGRCFVWPLLCHYFSGHPFISKPVIDYVAGIDDFKPLVFGGLFFCINSTVCEGDHIAIQ